MDMCIRITSNELFGRLQFDRFNVPVMISHGVVVHGTMQRKLEAGFLV